MIHSFHFLISIQIVVSVNLLAEKLDSMGVMNRMEYKPPKDWKYSAQMSGIFWMKGNPSGDILATFAYGKAKNDTLIVRPYRDWTWRSDIIAQSAAYLALRLKYKFTCEEENNEGDCVLFDIVPFGFSPASLGLRALNLLTSFEMEPDEKDKTRWLRFGRLGRIWKHQHYTVIQLIDGNGKPIEKNMLEFRKYMCSLVWNKSVFYGKDNSEAEYAIEIDNLNCEELKKATSPDHTRLKYII